MRFYLIVLVGFTMAALWPVSLSGQRAFEQEPEQPRRSFEADPPREFDDEPVKEDGEPLKERDEAPRRSFNEQPALAIERANADTAPRLDPPYLGVMVDDRQGLGGLVVVQAIAGGPAAQAGVLAGDLITSIDGQPVRNLADLSKPLVGQSPGKKVDLEVTRQGQTRKLELTLGSRQTPSQPPATSTPGQTPAPWPASPAPNPWQAAQAPRLGVRAEPLSPASQAQFGLGPTAGVYVAGVATGSAADEAKLPAGSVIIAVDKQPIHTPDELGAVLQKAGHGAELDVTYMTTRGQELHKSVKLPSQSGGTATTPVASSGAGAKSRPLDSPSGESPTRIESLERRIKQLEERIADLESELLKR